MMFLHCVSGIAFGVAVVNVAIVVKAGGLRVGEKIFDDAAFDAVFARLPKLAREQIAVVFEEHFAHIGFAQ